jgi:hypothetical protein
MKKIFIAVNHHDTRASFRSLRAHSRASHLKPYIVHQLSRQSGKLSNFLEKKGTQRHDIHTIIDTYIMDSSMCIEHIINSVLHRIEIPEG